MKYRFAWLMFITLALLVGGVAGYNWQDDREQKVEDQDVALDPLIEFEIAISEGAAPEYVPDESCAQCHREIFESFTQVGMGNAFMRPRAEVFIADYENNHFYHEHSQRHYEMIQEGDTLRFRRYQLDEAGQETNIFEKEVDWLLGSGHTSRSYLYQTAIGELYLLPISWYSQTQSWGMSPGYDRASHAGVTRPVRRECMFCHNSYPNVPTGSDTHLESHLYPQDLPEGLGCQRCHGPGGEHVRVSIADPLNYNPIRTSIFNIDGSDTKAWNDVCYQCHLFPSVKLASVRRFGRGDYSFEAGEALVDYLIHFDVDIEGEDRSERFEIDHHPYRLEQSQCYIQSEGKMNCMTCHDPHRKIPPEQQAEHYLNVCLECHQPHGYIPPTEPIARLAENGMIEFTDEVDADDCVFCHMPQRRTQDVVQVVMTDHYIRRHPPTGSEFLDPLEEKVPIVQGVEFLNPDTAPEGELGEVYRAVAVLRAGGRGNENVVDYLADMLDTAQPSEVTPYLELAKGQIQLRHYTDAEQLLRSILINDADQALVYELLGISLMGQGRFNEALAPFQMALEIDPSRAETYYNLGLLRINQMQYEEALESFGKALEIRPNFTAALFRQADTYVSLEKQAEAVRLYYKTLEVDPAFGRAYVALGRTLWEIGETKEALDVLNHGVNVANNREAISELIGELQ